MVINSDKLRIWKKPAVVYLKMSQWHSANETEQNYEHFNQNNR
jgi:hypothetical protein